MWNRRYYYREKIKKAACWALKGVKAGSLFAHWETLFLLQGIHTLYFVSGNYISAEVSPITARSDGRYFSEKVRLFPQLCRSAYSRMYVTENP